MHAIKSTITPGIPIESPDRLHNIFARKKRMIEEGRIRW